MMKKKPMLSVLSLCLVAGLSSCINVAPGAGEEAVLIHKPYIFGHGGIDDKPVETGRQYEWFSTSYVIVSMLPQKFDEKLDDAASNDNTLLDFNTQIQLQVEDNKSPVLIKNYGNNWYVNVIQEVYRNTVRNYISKFGPFDLMSNREVLDSINFAVKGDMERYIDELSAKSGELPIDVVNVVVGRAIPNEKQKAEMDNTAAATQAKRTEESRFEMLKAKEAAGAVDNMLAGAKVVGAVKVLTMVIADADAAKLRQMGDVLRDKDASVAAVLASAGNGKVTFLAVCGKDAVKAGVKAGDIVKHVCTVCGGNGGGKPDSAMGGGKHPDKMDEALNGVADFVATKVK